MQNLISAFAIAALLLQTPSLDSPSPKERQAAIEQMATIGNAAAIAPLTEALKKEPKADLRADILAAFGRIRDRGAIPALADSMRNDPDKDVRLQAIDSMLHLYIQVDDNGPLHTIFNKVKSTFQQPDPPVIAGDVQVDAAAKEALAQTLQKDFTDEVRVAAARALRSLQAKDQVPALIATLDDPKNSEHPDVRIEVIRTLGALRDPSAAPSIEKALHDNNKSIVAESATAAGLIADTNARATLEDLFRSSTDRTIRSNALASLALLRDPASSALFESLLGNQNDQYRELAAEGLARLKYDPKILKDRYDQEKKDNVKNALAFGLAIAGQNDYINDLANALDTRLDYQAEAYLYELGKFEGKLPELYRYLHSTNPKVRAKMVHVIGNIADPSSRDQIQALTSDPNIDVAREAVAALRKLSGSL